MLIFIPYLYFTMLINLKKKYNATKIKFFYTKLGNIYV